MRRKNATIEKINAIQVEVDRLHDRIPVDVDERFDLWLRILRNVSEQLESLENLVELEEQE
jgi:hypothetical protein|tara:strand:+ start:133 stop:315 length:183 start_codon:yes stop_codon:yes gene_type:complete